jgi:hypothetical protein
MMARKAHLSIATLEQTPEWRNLTVKQTFWLRSYVESDQDLTWATQVTHECNSLETARTFGYQFLRNKKIRAALDRYWCRTKRNILLDAVRADIKASKPGSPARAKLRELEAKLIGVEPKRKSK